MHDVEAGTLEQGQRVIELTLSLTAEANDDVRRKAQVRNDRAHLFDQPLVRLDAIATRHPAEHLIVPGLNRQVHVFADLRKRGDRFHQRAVEVEGVGGQEPDTLQTVDLADIGAELAQCVPDVAAVPVDDLTEEHDLFRSTSDEVLDLAADHIGPSAALVAAAEGDDAIRAAAVAALTDRDRLRNAGDALAIVGIEPVALVEIEEVRDLVGQR